MMYALRCVAVILRAMRLARVFTLTPVANRKKKGGFKTRRYEA
jgi:hypothetical protein